MKTFAKKVKVMKIVEFFNHVQISVGLTFLHFESICTKLSNGQYLYQFSIICLRKKKGMFVSKNSSDYKLREVLTCASLIRGYSGNFSYFYERWLMWAKLGKRILKEILFLSLTFKHYFMFIEWHQFSFYNPNGNDSSRRLVLLGFPRD